MAMKRPAGFRVEAGLFWWQDRSAQVRKNTNQTMASAMIASAVLATRRLRTDGPRSACRASCALSTTCSPRLKGIASSLFPVRWKRPGREVVPARLARGRVMLGGAEIFGTQLRRRACLHAMLLSERAGSVPLVRYFVVVACVLLAMLAVANWSLPNPPPLPSQETEVDKSTLRIRSERKWPQKIEFDTAMDPFIAPSAPPAVATAAPAAAAATREKPALNALAQAKPPELEITKPKSKMRTVRRASRSAPRVVVAANPTAPGWSFGWGEQASGPQKQPVDTRTSSRNNWFGERSHQNVASWSWGGSNDW